MAIPAGRTSWPALTVGWVRFLVDGPFPVRTVFFGGVAIGMIAREAVKRPVRAAAWSVRR